MKKEIKTFLYVLLAAVFFIGLFILCDHYADEIKSEYSDQINPSVLKQGGSSSGNVSAVGDLSVEQQVIELIRQDFAANITLTAAGDILCQSDQLEYAYDSSTDSFDFSESFEYVTDIFLSSDYAVATLKTTLAGQNTSASGNYHGYTASYSSYNSPEVLAENIRDAGICLVNIATNHTLDKGAAGLSSTIDFLDAEGLSHVGAAKSSEDATDISVNIDGVQIGFIGYTNTSNATVSSSAVINILNDYNQTDVDTFCSRVTEMDAENDLVVVMLNFGSVDSDSIETKQRELATQLAEAGADLILGTGSTVLKPVEYLSVTNDENEVISNCLVLYGMGALLSSETYSAKDGKDMDISAIFDFNVVRTELGDTYLSSFTVIPVYLNWYDSKIQIIPVCEAKDTSKYDDELDEEDEGRIDSAYENTMTHLLDGSGLSCEYKDYSYVVQLQ